MKTPKVKLIWTGGNRYLGGRTLRKGDELLVSRRDAMLYRATRVAVDAPQQAATPPPQAPAPVVDEMATIRAEYERTIGRRPFMGWDAETLREKINTYQRRDMRAEE